MRHKLLKCRIFAKQLRRSLNAVKAIARLQNSKTYDYVHASFRMRKKKTKLILKTITFYSVFSALFIAVGYIVAQALKFLLLNFFTFKNFY